MPSHSLSPCITLLASLSHTLPCTQAYKVDPLFVEGLECRLSAFVASKSARLALQPMPKAQRALVHEYAEAGWGLVSSSVGAEPSRAVQLFKTPTSGARPHGWD